MRQTSNSTYPHRYRFGRLSLALCAGFVPARQALAALTSAAPTSVWHASEALVWVSVAALLFLSLFAISAFRLRRLRRQLKARGWMESKPTELSLSRDFQARTMLDNLSGVAVHAYDQSGRVIYWNAAAENLYGWRADEVAGKTPDQFRQNAEWIFPNELSEPAAHAVGISESEYRRKDGHGGWVLSALSEMPLGLDRTGLVRMDVDITQRKLAECELLRSQRKYQSLLDDIGEKFLVFSHTPISGEILYVSDGISHMLGMDRQAVLGKVWYSLFKWLPDALVQAQTQVMRLAIGKSEFVQYEMEYVHPDGRVRTVQVSSHPVRDEQGNVATIDGILEDISERKQAEKELQRHRHHLEEMVGERTAELRRQQAFTEAVLEHVSDGIVACDQKGILSLFNRAAKDLHGADLENLAPDQWAKHYRLMLPDGVTPMPTEQVPLFRAFQAEQIRNQELVIERAHGEKLCVLCSGQAMQDKDGRKIGAVISMRDITQQKKAEAELILARDKAESASRAHQLNESRLNAMLQLSEAAPHMSERDLLQHGLEQAERLTGSQIAYLHFLSADQENIQLNLWSSNTFKHCKADYSAHFPVSVAGVWADAVRQKQAVIHNDYQHLPDRHGYPERHVHLLRHMAVPILQDDQVKIIIGVGNKAEAYDDADLRQVQLIGDSLWKIVSLRRTLKNLEAALDFAEAANRAKTVFLANMSHELRTPLNAILGFAQLLGRDSNLPDDKRQQIAIINRSGEHLLALINDILEISRIEQGRTRVSREAFDLAAALDAVAETARIQAINKSLGFIMERGADLPAFVVGDVCHLRQVLLNLLGNAVKYTAKGKVRLSVTLAPEQRIRFEVGDSGPGIAEAEHERIFQPFYQIKGSATKGEGTGLGLTISREFVRLMGGELTVESQMGLGSVFRFSLPLAPAEALAKADAGRRVVGLATGQKAPRILIAEAQADDRQLIRQILEQIGCEVAVAASGEQVLELFESWKPELLLMNLQLPGISGYEAVRRIRAAAQGELPIIALVASELLEDEEQVAACGCDDLLAKPINADRLFDTLGRRLQLKFEFAALDETPAAAVSVENIETLASMPPPILQELVDAAVALDQDQAFAIVERIRPDYPIEADMISKLIEGFRFDEIIKLRNHLEDSQGSR